MIITYTKSYEDTPENILFGAKYYGYKEMVNDPADTNPMPHLVAQIPNPQSAGDFMVEKLDEVIKNFLTAPVTTYIRQKAMADAEAQAEQASQVVIDNIK